MRSAGRRLIGLLLAFLGGAWAVLPGLLLAAWGVTYFVGVVEALLAPGVPIEFRYDAPEGSMLARAESYAIDLAERQLHASRISLADPSGRRLASAGRLLVRLGTAVEVSAFDAWGRLERLPNGRFSAERWFPPSPERREPTPFAVHVNRVSLDFVDRYQGPPLPLRAEASRVDVDSDGVGFLAFGRIRLAGRGTEVPVRVYWVPDFGTRVEAALAGDEMAPLIPNIRRWVDPAQLRDLEPLQAASLRPSGRIVATDTPRDGLWFSADLRVVASGLAVRDVVEQAEAAADVAVRGRGVRFSGEVAEAGRRANLDGVLLAGDRPWAAARVEAQGVSIARSWPILRKTLPRELSATAARWSGWLALRDGRLAARGNVAAERIAWGDESGRGASGAIDFGQDGLRIQVSRIVARGERLRGSLFLGRERLAGYARGDRLSVAKATPGTGLSGAADALALISGTPGRPRVELMADGQVRVKAGDRVVDLGRAQMRAALGGRKLEIARLTSSGPRGTASAQGVVDLDGQADVSVVGGGFSLADFDPEADGLVFLDGKVRGRLSDPTLWAVAEAYGVRAPGVDLEIPVAASRLRVNRRVVFGELVEAAVGATVVRGRVDYRLSDRRLDGVLSAQRVELADWTDGAASGLAAFDSLRLSGTPTEPKLAGPVGILKLSVGDVEMENVVADLSVDRRGIVVEAARANVAGEGELTGSGRYAFEGGRFSAEGQVDAWPLGHLPGVRGRLDEVDGSVSGSFAFAGDAEGFRSASADLGVLAAAVGTDVLGDGRVTVGMEGTLLKGEARLGEVLRIEGAAFDPEGGSVAGRVVLDRLAAGTAFAVAKAAGVRISRSVEGTIDGRLSATASLSGTKDDPAIDLERVAGEGLTVEGKPAGAIEAVATRRSGRWQVARVLWSQADTRLTASGQVDEAGPIALDIDLANFELELLAPYWPRLASVEGRADATIRATGTWENPELLASATARLAPRRAEGDGAEPADLDVLLDQVTLRDRVWALDGRFAYAGLTGTLAGSGTTTALGASPDPADQLRVEAKLDEREIASLAKDAPWLDPERSSGRIGGTLLLAGNRDGYRIDGRIRAEDAAVAAAGLDTALRDLNLDLHTDGGSLVVEAAAKSTMGGTVAASLRANLPPLFERGATLQSTLADSSLSGYIELKEFGATQSGFFKDGRGSGQAGGRIELAGTLLEPVLAGDIELQALDLALPSEFVSGASRAPMPIRPRFDIAVRADQVFRIRSGASTFDVTGGGSISGTLDEPSVSGRLVLSRGIFRLPNARLELEPGGTLAFGYRSVVGGLSDAFLDVDLLGRTTISAARFDSVERYDVAVEVRGDVLSPSGVVLSARSEPPDLTQDQILAIVGQKQVFEGISQAGVVRTRDLLSQVLLPSLLTPVTDTIASGLGLDFLGVEYNAFDETTVYAAKSLGKGLVVQMSQQVNQTRNVKRRYEVRLTYRIPSRNPLLSRARIGFGFDQDRPWKITLDYTFRL